MKVAALQTGSLFGDLLEVPASGQKTAQAVEGADFTAVLEEAGQALQAPAAKETSPVVAEILSTATAEARLAEETVLPRVQAPVIMPRSDRPLPVPEVQPTIISATGADQPVVELVAVIAAPEQPLPQNGEGVRQPQHPETRGASRNQHQHPQPLTRNEEEIIPQNVAPRGEARPIIPLAAEGKREASVKAGSTERQEKSVVAEEVVVAQTAPAVVIAAAGLSMTEVPAQRGEERTLPAIGLEKGETADVLSRPVTAAATPAAVRVAPPQQDVRRDETVEAVKAGVAKPETVETEVVKLETVTAQVVKPEVTKAEVVKPEAVKAEVVKAEGARPEAVKAEVVKPEAVKAEVVRPDTVKTEVVKAEVARPEAVKAEVVKPEVVKAEVVKPETVMAEVVKAEGARPEAVKAEVVKPTVVKAEVVKPEMVKAEAVKPEAAPIATRFEVAQGVAGYRENAFAASLQKAPVAEVSVQAAPAVKEAVIVSTAPVANPVQEITPTLSGEKADAVIPKAAAVPAEQGVVLSEKKQEAEAPIAVKPSAITGETVKQAQPETAPASEPKAVVAQAAEAVRDPHRTVALRQQSPRQEKVEEQVEPTSKSAIETGAAKPVVEVAVREKSGAEAGGEKKQNFPEGAPHKHLEGLQQPLDVNRPQFQPAEPVKPEMPETAKNPLHESILSQIKDKVETTNVDGNREVTVRLNPEELGELTINIRMDGRNVKVDVVAENATVKEALMENIDRLKETFSKQNMTMEQFDVSTGNGGRFQQQAQREQRAAHHAAWFGGSASPAHFAADEQKVAAYYKPRENSLIDVRF